MTNNFKKNLSNMGFQCGATLLSKTLCLFAGTMSYVFLSKQFHVFSSHIRMRSFHCTCLILSFFFASNEVTKRGIKLKQGKTCMELANFYGIPSSYLALLLLSCFNRE